MTRPANDLEANRRGERRLDSGMDLAADAAVAVAREHERGDGDAGEGEAIGLEQATVRHQQRTRDRAVVADRPARSFFVAERRLDAGETCGRKIPAGAPLSPEPFDEGEVVGGEAGRGARQLKLAHVPAPPDL